MNRTPVWLSASESKEWRVVMRHTDSGLDRRTAGVQPVAISEGFCCPATCTWLLLLSVKSESTHTSNTHAALKAFQSALPLHPHTHNKPVLHPHTLTLSQKYTFSPYTNSHTYTLVQQGREHEANPWLSEFWGYLCKEFKQGFSTVKH